MLITFVSSGRLSKAAGYKVSSHAQRAIGSPIDVFDQHVNIGVLPPGGQLKQLIKSLREGRGDEECFALIGSYYTRFPHLVMSFQGLYRHNSLQNSMNLTHTAQGYILRMFLMRTSRLYRSSQRKRGRLGICQPFSVVLLQ